MLKRLSQGSEQQAAQWEIAQVLNTLQQVCLKLLNSTC